MGKGLRIVHLNIRSLAKNFDELFILFDDYDIILLSETWLNNSYDSNLIKRKGFELFRQDRDQKINKRGGGLAAYVKSEIALHTTIMDNICNITCCLEQFWLIVKEPDKKQFVVGIVYRPPAGSLKNCLLELKLSISQVFEVRGNKEHIIMGDFNIDFNHPEQSNCKNLKEIMNEFGLRRMVTGYTRVTERCKSIIDLIYTDMQHVTEAGVRNVIISDHLPVFVIKKKPRNVMRKEIKQMRLMGRYSRESIEILIRNDNRWMKFWEEDVSVDELWSIMYKIFLDALNILCPYVEKSIQVDKLNWVTKNR